MLKHLIIVIALFYAGLIQAAHFHKPEFGGQGKAEAACLICAHSAQAAAPAAPPVHHAALAVLVEVAAVAATAPSSLVPSSYHARGPPLI